MKLYEESKLLLTNNKHPLRFFICFLFALVNLMFEIGQILFPHVHIENNEYSIIRTEPTYFRSHYLIKIGVHFID